MQARQAAVCRLSQFRFTPIRRFTLPTRPCFSCPLEPDPSDDPKLYDILISDVDRQTLGGDISKALGYKYLESISPEYIKPQPEIPGILFGRHHRLFFCLATTFNGRSHYLHFLLDTGSPYTYLADDVSGN
jgi:hypothetical protein